MKANELLIRKINRHPLEVNDIDNSFSEMRKELREAAFYRYYYWWFHNFKEPHIRTVTVEKHLFYCRFLAENFPRLKLKDFETTRQVLQFVLNKFGETRRHRSLINFKEYLFSALRFAQEDGYIRTFKHENIELHSVEETWDSERLAKQKNTKKWLDIGEFNELMNYVDFKLDELLDKKVDRWKYKNGNSIQGMYMTLALAIHTGARLSEILAITFDDVSENEAVIDKAYDYKYSHTFARTKNVASIRTVHIDKKLYRLICKYKRFVDSNNIQIGQGGMVIENGMSVFNDTYNRFLGMVLNKLDIEAVTFHKIRHSYVSVLLSNDIDPMFIAKQVGHTDTNMINKVYGHLQKEIEKREAEKVKILL